MYNNLKLTKMENKKFEACRVVLTSGEVLMNYYNGAMYGFACAGFVNGNHAIPYADGQEEFERTAKEWADMLNNRGDVEYIEFI